MEFIERLRTTAGVVTDVYTDRDEVYRTKSQYAEWHNLGDTDYELFTVTGVTGNDYKEAVRSFVGSDERLKAVPYQTDFGTIFHFILLAPTPEEQAFIDQVPVKNDYWEYWQTGKFYPVLSPTEHLDKAEFCSAPDGYIRTDSLTDETFLEAVISGEVGYDFEEEQPEQSQ